MNYLSAYDSHKLLSFIEAAQFKVVLSTCQLYFTDR